MIPDVVLRDLWSDMRSNRNQVIIIRCPLSNPLPGIGEGGFPGFASGVGCIIGATLMPVYSLDNAVSAEGRYQSPMPDAPLLATLRLTGKG